MNDRHLRVAIGVIAALGVAIAGYLTYARFAHQALVCATGGCETVQSSDYAELLGIPVAVLGLGAYGFVLGTAFSSRLLARAAGAATALAGSLFAAYLLAAQVFVIDALCHWCVASDVVLVLLAGACTLRLHPSIPAENP